MRYFGYAASTYVTAREKRYEIKINEVLCIFLAIMYPNFYIDS